METPSDLYDVLELTRKATDGEIRRAYRTLATRYHPDKPGGDAQKFKQIKRAYDILGKQEKRKAYDTTGQVSRSAEEEFADVFAGGAFGVAPKDYVANKENLTEQLAVRSSPNQQVSHNAGFEAWLRSRGENGTMVFTAETMAEQYGVVKGTYTSVQLPRLDSVVARCEDTGTAQDVVETVAEPLPAELEYGQVLVAMRAAPINTADLDTVESGGSYGQEHVAPPFTAGHDGVGVVLQVGDGVKGLRAGEWVLPLKTHLGTWCSLAVQQASNLLPIEPVLPIEYAAISTQLLLAYRLLEDSGLKPGDCVILNAANSTVGTTIIQLCALLNLRSVAVIRAHPNADKTIQHLKDLGATHVFLDYGSIKDQLDQHKFFAKPKLALDAVGGPSAVRISEALAEGGQVIVYGSLSKKPTTWPWQAWVYSGIQVKGFSLRSWLTKNKTKVNPILEALRKLIEAGKLQISFTDYDLATELKDALDHAASEGANSKVLLRMSEVGGPKPLDVEA